MKQFRAIIRGTHLVSLFSLTALFLITGCGGAGKAIYRIDADKLCEYDNTQKLDYTVELRMDPRLCNTKYFVNTGLTYYADMGGAFCYNAKLLAESLFKKVIVTNGKKKVDADLIMAPRAIKLNKSAPIFDPKVPQVVETKPTYAWDRSRMAVYVSWIIAKANKKVLWVDVIEGLAEGKMGGPFSYKSNSIDLIRKAMKDMFKNTHETVLKTAHFLQRTPTPQTMYKYEFINWRIAKTRGSQKAYENFLNHFPDSVFAPEASKALDQIKKNGPDATTYACEGWASVQYGMSFDEAIDTLGSYGLIRNKKVECNTQLSGKSSEKTCTNKDWTLKFYNGKLVEKDHFILCGEWEEYYFPFLLKYLKLADPSPKNTGRSGLHSGQSGLR